MQNCIERDGVIYVSGQFSVDPDTGERKFGTEEEETLQALMNIELILKGAGSDRSRILRTTAYVCSMEEWGNKIEKGFCGDAEAGRETDCHHGKRGMEPNSLWDIRYSKPSI